MRPTMGDTQNSFTENTMAHIHGPECMAKAERVEQQLAECVECLRMLMKEYRNGHVQRENPELWERCQRAAEARPSPWHEIVAQEVDIQRRLVEGGNP